MDIGRHYRLRISRLSVAVVGRFLGAAVLALVLAGCAIHRTLAPDAYIVQRGDTLSAIGAEYGINWHNLAQWNHIRSPYNLEVGQRLWLTPYPPINYAKLPGQTSQSAPAPRQPSQPRQRVARDNPPALHRTIESQPEWSAGASSVQEGGTTETATSPSLGSASSSDSQASMAQADQGDDARISQASHAAATKQASIKAGGPSEDGWQWPASGSLIREYDPDDGRHGVEIGGQVGAPIYAASSGTVVYNGSGLKGYGKLVIVKHDKHYLSAYGFNKRSLVKQGQTVAAGAHIADMGLGPGNKPMLHFEIRRDGEPIDPQKVLPKH